MSEKMELEAKAGMVQKVFDVFLMSFVLDCLPAKKMEDAPRWLG